jgi:hypothetical protein
MRDLPKFSTLDEAKDYFQHQSDVSQKYGILFKVFSDV